MMDPEPGRCRRTDGKKWRCSKNVLSDQKYCEKHIHRGRQRSRKLVEASKCASPSGTTEPEKLKGELLQNPTSNLSVSVGLQLMTPSPNDTCAGHCTTNTNITSNFSKKRVSYVTSPIIATNTASDTVTSAIATTNTLIPAATASATTVVTNAKTNQKTSETAMNVFTSTKANQNTPKNVSEKHFGHNRMIRGGSNNNSSNNSNGNIIVGRNMSTRLGFSPKSVLQVVGRDGLCIGNSTVAELEPGRCRRTDGKKWRCRRDIVPNQKYCPRHMHRGAKKLAKASEPTPASSSATNTALPCPIAEIRASPNTNLCISIPTSPPPISNDEKSSSSTSSDATITDTSISAYVISKTSS